MGACGKSNETLGRMTVAIVQSGVLFIQGPEEDEWLLQ